MSTQIKRNEDTKMTSFATTSLRTKEGKAKSLIIATIAQAAMSGGEVECGNATFRHGYSCGYLVQMGNSVLWGKMRQDEWLEEIRKSVEDEYAENLRSGQSWDEIYHRVVRNSDCGNFKFSSLSISMA